MYCPIALMWLGPFESRDVSYNNLHIQPICLHTPGAKTDLDLAYTLMLDLRSLESINTKHIHTPECKGWTGPNGDTFEKHERTIGG